MTILSALKGLRPKAAWRRQHPVAAAPGRVTLDGVQGCRVAMDGKQVAVDVASCGRGWGSAWPWTGRRVAVDGTQRDPGRGAMWPWTGRSVTLDGAPWLWTGCSMTLDGAPCGRGRGLWSLTSGGLTAGTEACLWRLQPPGQMPPPSRYALTGTCPELEGPWPRVHGAHRAGRGSAGRCEGRGPGQRQPSPDLRLCHLLPSRSG